MGAYLATRESALRGGIHVLPAWWGLNNFFKGLCDRLAKEDFLALAPDFYHWTDALNIPEADILRRKIKRNIVIKDILDAIERLQTQPSIQNRLIGVILSFQKDKPTRARLFVNLRSEYEKYS